MKSEHKIQIFVAVIALIGSIVVGVLSNWDKLFGQPIDRDAAVLPIPIGQGDIAVAFFGWLFNHTNKQRDTVVEFNGCWIECADDLESLELRLHVNRS